MVYWINLAFFAFGRSNIAFLMFLKSWFSDDACIDEC